MTESTAIRYNNSILLGWMLLILLLYSIQYFLNLFSPTSLILTLIYIIEVAFIGFGSIYLTNYLIKKNKLPLSFLFYLIIFCSYLIAHLALNFSDLSLNRISDILKLTSYVLIFFITYISTKESVNTKTSYKLEAYFVYVPLVLLILDSIIYQGGHKGVSSIFYNSNNAAFYAIVSSTFLLRVKKYNIFAIYLIISLMILMKLGAFIALAISSMLYFIQKVRITPRLLTWVFFIILISILVIITSDSIGLFSRFFKVFDHLIILLEHYSLYELANISYGQAIVTLNDPNADLSFLFRIKQTFELTYTYTTGSIAQMILGFGGGTIPLYSSNNLVAHNDFVTILFEYGFIAFLLFTLPQLVFLARVRKHVYFIPLFAIFIYFFLENLYFNYIATSIYFFLLAHITTNKKYHN